MVYFSYIFQTFDHFKVDPGAPHLLASQNIVELGRTDEGFRILNQLVRNLLQSCDNWFDVKAFDKALKKTRL